VASDLELSAGLLVLDAVGEQDHAGAGAPHDVPVGVHPILECLEKLVLPQKDVQGR
jgi:hypothetical protein